MKKISGKQPTAKKKRSKIPDAIIKLKQDDAAFVIRADGSEEIVVQHRGSDDNPMGKCAMTIIAVATILHDPKMAPFLAELVSVRMERVMKEDEKAEQPAEPKHK